jgi:hypothetical protein
MADTDDDGDTKVIAEAILLLEDHHHRARPTMSPAFVPHMSSF